jgi:hypothetical protein
MQLGKVNKEMNYLKIKSGLLSFKEGKYYLNYEE